MNKKILLAVLTAVTMMISAVNVLADDQVGAVYAMTNAVNGNEVVIFDRNDFGMLTSAGSIATGGAGSGSALDPLGSQGSLMLNEDHRWLIAVNAGSHEISIFRVMPDGLELVNKVDSGGVFPVSVTIFHDLVYVLNAGGSPNITGFSLSHRGELTPLTSSTRSLGAGGFAQIGFDPRGEKLVITDKADNKILVYSVGQDGLPSMTAVTSPSFGLTPFGFIFDKRGHLLVVEAGTNAVSSYGIMPDDTLQVISGSVPNGQKAACWIAGNKRGEVFTDNPGTHSISAYRLMTGTGTLALIDGTAGTGNTPLDLSITGNGSFLYALDPANGAIDIFRIDLYGTLTDLGSVAGGFAISAQGIAAR